MQDTVTVEEVSAIERKISIGVSSDTVDKKMTEFFQGIKGEVQVPGFRKGKAPVSRMKQFFGQKARGSIAQMLISEFYSQAIRDYDFNPVGNPTIKEFQPGDEYPGKFGYDNSYTVDLVVETLPKVDPEGYKGLELNFPEHNLDEIVERKLLEYREQFAEHNQITDRGAQNGDSLVIDFTGKLKGESEPFSGGSAKDFSLEKLGTGNFIPGFEEQMIGMTLETPKTITVTFPEKYHAAHLAGKEAEFEVVIHSIVETKLAEIDDDLAMMVGYETVDELNEYIRGEAEKEANNLTKRILNNQIVQELIKKNEFEVPKSMVRFEHERLVKQMNNQNRQLPQEAVDALQHTARFNVQKAILIDSIYEKEEDIEVTPAELESMLETHAARNNTTKDELASMLYRTNQMDAFMGVLRTEKVIDFIIENAVAKTESEEKSGDK